MKKVILLILIIAGYACTGSRKEGCESIDLEAALGHVGELSVADIGGHLSCVPLETTDESLIGKRAYVRMLKDKLLVGSFQQPVKMFDKKTGKFIRTVGAIGQGANEYTLQNNIPVFWVDDVAEMIYVQTEGKSILRFDMNGEPLDNVSLPDSFPLMNAVSQITIENKLYIYHQTLFSKPDYKILMYDIPGRKIQERILNDKEAIPMDLSQTPIIFGGFGNIPVSTACLIFNMKNDRMALLYTKELCLWTFDKNVYFKESFNDTIYLL